MKLKIKYKEKKYTTLSSCVGFASGGSTGIPKRCFRPVTQAAARQRRYDERINVRVEQPLWRRGAGGGGGPGKGKKRHHLLVNESRE